MLFSKLEYFTRVVMIPMYKWEKGKLRDRSAVFFT